ncbi:hypothetical protein [Nocardia crassostreae]|uniref:hypothetical protein n=1 Tax=Nocardia crassostreae TaxID=53428 RepID=UPI00083027A0|nr:hypothetical protein [Nocardia crassostreae]
MPKKASTVPRAPRGLRAHGSRLWRELHEVFDFSQDPHRAAVIEDICRTADLIDRLQAEVDKGDLRVKGSQGQPVSAPEIPELRLQREALVRMLARLDLPETAEQREAKTARLTEIRRDAAKSARFKVVTDGHSA